MSAPIITAPKALATQVGGHAGVQASEDGSLLIKPALPLELQFYQSLTSIGAFAPLRPFLPKFFGTLNLMAQDQASEPDPGQKESLVLENLSHPFSKPNILDIKLGTVLYDETASPEKVERMIKTAKETTSLETGLRLTGFQVFNNTTNEAINTPKTYGKSIKVADLPDGVRRFFPTTDSGSGLPPNLLLPIITHIRDTISEIHEVFAELEIRMVGGSLLVIYEADCDKAKIGIEAMENGEFDEPETIDEDGEDEEEESKPKATPPCIVKMIDFAHTKLVPGEGKDEGVCLGMKTTLDLLDGRIKEVKAMME